jgi:hypothetical protein
MAQPQLPISALFVRVIFEILCFNAEVIFQSKVDAWKFAKNCKYLTKISEREKYYFYLKLVAFKAENIITFCLAN